MSKAAQVDSDGVLNEDLASSASTLLHSRQLTFRGSALSQPELFDVRAVALERQLSGFCRTASNPCWAARRAVDATNLCNRLSADALPLRTAEIPVWRTRCRLQNRPGCVPSAGCGLMRDRLLFRRQTRLSNIP